MRIHESLLPPCGQAEVRHQDRFGVREQVDGSTRKKMVGKDTIICISAVRVTRIRLKFAEGRAQFTWHCHAVEHEDHEMMRPYRDLAQLRPLGNRS